LIVVGASLGGVQAIQALLTGLPASFALPIVAALHRHRDSDRGLVELIQRTSALHVVEAQDKQAIEPGTVFLAPADYHLLIDGDHLALSVDEPVRYARPSIDVLFESAAGCGRHVTAIVLTGGGADGASGVAAIEANGGDVIVQDPSEAASSDMPLAALAVTKRSQILSIDAIARRLAELTNE
jgi:two-component system, chemotaxis family, protein-glutamate methylesterase/glutaminase